VKLFLSYRRDDPWGASTAHRLYDVLVQRYQTENIFLDVDAIPAGTDFRDVIEKSVRRADGLLVLMGDQWTALMKKKGKSADDFVRLEVKCALEARLFVIPVLIGQATQMPLATDLPSDIAALASKNAAPLDTGRDFPAHARRLIDQIDRREVKARQVTDLLWGSHVDRTNASDYGPENRAFAEEIERKAEAGDPEAQFANAEFWREGASIPAEWGTAMSWYRKAAEQGFLPAMYHLAYELERGWSDFVNGKYQLREDWVDYKEAALWYKKVSDALHELLKKASS
jgi:hypothetical protein